MNPDFVWAEIEYRMGQRPYPRRRLFAAGRIPPTNPQPPVECGWCGALLRAGHRSQPTTHSICLPCRAEYRRQEGVVTTPEADDG